MYILTLILTIIGVFGLNKLQKGLIKDMGFLWLSILDLEILNSIEHKVEFNYLILILFGIMFYWSISRKDELVAIIVKKFKAKK